MDDHLPEKTGDEVPLVLDLGSLFTLDKELLRDRSVGVVKSDLASLLVRLDNTLGAADGDGLFGESSADVDPEGHAHSALVLDRGRQVVERVAPTLVRFKRIKRLKHPKRVCFLLSLWFVFRNK